MAEYLNLKHVYRQVFSRLRGVEKRKDGWVARCPAHDDKVGSLSVRVGANDRLLLRCHAGGKCDIHAILQALDLEMGDLFADADTADVKRTTRKFVCAYDYRDADGTLLFQVTRWLNEDGTKTFRQRRPNPAYDQSKPRDKERNPEWLWGRQGCRLVLYRLPDLIASLKDNPDRYVLLMEGEKAVDLAWQMGFTATCSPGGAGHWSDPAFVGPLRNANVVALPDNDPPDQRTGHVASARHFRVACATLLGVARTVRWIDLPNLPPKGDFYDWADRVMPFVAQKALADLIRATPLWSPKPSDLARVAVGAVARDVAFRDEPGNWDEVLGAISTAQAAMAAMPAEARRQAALDLAGRLVRAAHHLGG